MLDQEIDQRRERILVLLDRHNLMLTYFEVFCKYIFAVEDAEGQMLWQTKGTDLQYLQKEICEYLEDYDAKHPIRTIQPGEGVATAGGSDELPREAYHPAEVRRDGGGDADARTAAPMATAEPAASGRHRADGERAHPCDDVGGAVGT